MGKVIDLTGMKFSRWTVTGFSHQKKSMFYWFCVCECGSEKAVYGADLKRGMSKSCGCLQKEVAAEAKKSHGLSEHPAYRSWIGIKTRCFDPNHDGFKDYGGRGITMCDEWRSFEGFWSDMGGTWAEGLSIDRIEVDGNYEPSNCKWSTPKEQGNNRRTCIYVDGPDGSKITVTEAADMHGIDRRSVYARIRYGWPESEWFKPVRPHAPRSPNKPKGEPK